MHVSVLGYVIQSALIKLATRKKKQIVVLAVDCFTKDSSGVQTMVILP
jgi:hypothetical protein